MVQRRDVLKVISQDRCSVSVVFRQSLRLGLTRKKELKLLRHQSELPDLESKLGYLNLPTGRGAVPGLYFSGRV